MPGVEGGHLGVVYVLFVDGMVNHFGQHWFFIGCTFDDFNALFRKLKHRFNSFKKGRQVQWQPYFHLFEHGEPRFLWLEFGSFYNQQHLKATMNRYILDNYNRCLNCHASDNDNVFTQEFQNEVKRHAHELMES